MNKIKQNKITFTLILSAIAIIFSSFAILSLPVLFNYKSKVTLIEKNFYKSFKVYIKSKGKISYKPFPKPHLLVENASLNLSKTEGKEDLLNTTNLKIFISLRDIYLRSFEDLSSTEISNSNLELEISDLKQLRDHLYLKINKPIIFNNCKIFLKNKKNEVILISPTKKISYKINNKTKIKNFTIIGEAFGLNFKSLWKRNYLIPKNSSHDISIINPKIEIKNIFEFENSKIFNIQSEINYLQDKIEYNIEYRDRKVTVFSPIKEKNNFNLNSQINLDPFYFEGELKIKNKKIENIIDIILLKLLLYDKSFLGNLNGSLKIKFDQLNNKLIKKGELSFLISEKLLKLNRTKFNLDKIGYINSNISFVKNNGDMKFLSENQLHIENHIEFAKVFQVSSKKVKNIKIIYFDIEKAFGDTDFTISNVKINDSKNVEKSDDIFIVTNIQNLRSHIRKVID